MEKVLVIGGAGFIGTALSKKLKDLKYKVDIADLKSKFKHQHKEFGCIGFDVRDYSSFSLFDREHYTHVYNLAAQTSGLVSQEEPEVDVDTNLKGTFNCYRYFKDKGISNFIYTSSMAVYGDSNIAINEEHDLNPKSNYGLSKLASEVYVKALADCGVNYTIARLFNVYGPGQDFSNLKQGMLSIFLAQAIQKEKIKITGSLDRYRDFVFIDDVVDFLISPLAESCLRNDVFNVGTGRKTTVKELVEGIVEKLQRDILYTDIGGHEGDQFGTYASIEKAQKVSSWFPKTSLEKGLDITIAHAKEVIK
ncbi:NAD-dependent epimerase/dehydratase family protein [Halomonas piscis]|uniref:NAD-dependent epimerase/dehydratase family protein n=1 Tax=Halomonas piscis TaxID=3031727 RepID=UPI0028998229|nr:NAD-dependent epimerase/dehydratase family protein [Halomonas piscis]